MRLYLTQQRDKDNNDRDVPAEKRPRLKETDVVFDGISDSDESGKSNGSEDEIARDDEGKESVDNDGKDSVDNNSEGSDDEEFQIRLNALFGQGDNELPTAGSGHAETTEDNSEEIQSQSLSLCDSGDVAQDEEVRLIHVSSDHDQEGGEGHVSNDQNWRRMDVNGNVPNEADDSMLYCQVGLT